jgi:hypothetical protein
MNRSGIKKVPILAAIIIVAGTLHPVFPDTLQGPVTSIVTVTADREDTRRISLAVGEIGGIHLNGDLRFLEGIEIEILIPDSATPYPGSFAINVFQNLNQPPEAGMTTFVGKRALFEPIPSGRRFFVLIPVKPDHEMRRTADTLVIRDPVPEEQFPLIFTIHPVMKGISRRAAESVFEAVIRPVIRNFGVVRLDVRDPDGETLKDSIFDLENTMFSIDGKPVTEDKDEIVLSPGLHRLTIQSDIFIDETLTFGVEKGRYLDLEVRLSQPQSIVVFESPRDAELFVNGEMISQDPPEISLPPGEHTILFQFGEYSISRRLTIEPHKDYKVTLSLDILINED